MNKNMANILYSLMRILEVGVFIGKLSISNWCQYSDFSDIIVYT